MQKNESVDLTQINMLTSQVISAAFLVHKTLGPGYLESVYEAAMVEELLYQRIRFNQQKNIAVTYRGKKVGESRVDLLVAEILIVELKAVEMILPIHKAQLLSYMKMMKLPVGLLINFNTVSMKEGIKRMKL